MPASGGVDGSLKGRTRLLQWHVEVLSWKSARWNLRHSFSAAGASEHQPVAGLGARWHLHHEHSRADVELVSWLLARRHLRLDALAVGQAERDGAPHLDALRHLDSVHARWPEPELDDVAGPRALRDGHLKQAVGALHANRLLPLLELLRQGEGYVLRKRHVRPPDPGLQGHGALVLGRRMLGPVECRRLAGNDSIHHPRREVLHRPRQSQPLPSTGAASGRAWTGEAELFPGVAGWGSSFGAPRRRQGKFLREIARRDPRDEAVDWLKRGSETEFFPCRDGASGLDLRVGVRT
mmetsp:Transcript_3854/g.9823  ORF Transcript_3854/g.9823 Transcript_3854/m.9823 type:complete len:294 (+) Transcript_3854:164-1045(+)